MSRLRRDGTAEPVSRDQILRHAQGQGNIHSPCSVDHEQDWQPYQVDPYSDICDDRTYIHTYRSRIHAVPNGTARPGGSYSHLLCGNGNTLRPFLHHPLPAQVDVIVVIIRFSSPATLLVAS